MPIAAERALRKAAERKFPGDKRRQDAYVYGALRHKFHWKPARELTGKEAGHAAH